MTEIQPRDTGGRWAEKRFGVPGSAAALQPYAEDVKRFDGTFRYPPRLRDAEEIIEFWSTVDVPDEACAQAERVYESTFEWVNTEYPEWHWDNVQAEFWEADNPRPAEGDVAALAEWDRERAEAKRVSMAEQREQALARPERLDKGDVRPIVRALAMKEAVNDLADQFTVERVLAHRLEVGGAEATVSDICMRTGLWHFAHNVVDTDKWVDEEQDGDAVRLSEKQVREMLDEVVSTLRADLSAVYNEVQAAEQRTRQQTQEGIDHVDSNVRLGVEMIMQRQIATSDVTVGELRKRGVLPPK